MLNAKDKTLSDLNALPDVSPSIDLLLQPMKVGLVQKAQVHGLTQETIMWKRTKVVRQAFSAEQLMIRPEGERSWKWYEIHATVDLILNTDDIILIHGQRLRIMEKRDYTEYGFVIYAAVEDYQQVIP